MTRGISDVYKRQVLEEQPQLVTARFYAATSALKLGNTDEAIEQAILLAQLAKTPSAKAADSDSTTGSGNAADSGGTADSDSAADSGGTADSDNAADSDYAADISLYALLQMMAFNDNSSYTGYQFAVYEDLTDAQRSAIDKEPFLANYLDAVYYLSLIHI